MKSQTAIENPAAVKNPIPKLGPEGYGSVFALQFLNGNAYSQRKNRIARIVQSAATPVITQIGNRMFPVLIPKKVFFIIVSPCVSGKKLTILCIAVGMTSMGSVVPEKISMGK